MSTIRPNAEPAATLVAAGDTFLIDGSTGVRALAATSVALRDANGNVALNNVIEGLTSTATAGATTTLTVASTALQYFTGTTTQTVVLPVTSTLALGQGFFFQNGSTGALTVTSSGGNVVIVVGPGAFAIVTCVLLTGTTAASWAAGAAATSIDAGGATSITNGATNNVLTDVGGLVSKTPIATLQTGAWKVQNLTATNDATFPDRRNASQCRLDGAL